MLSDPVAEAFGLIHRHPRVKISAVCNHLHFGHTLPDVTVIRIKVSYSVDLLPTNANLGRIMRIMEINIWLLKPLFVLNIQIFDINI